MRFVRALAVGAVVLAGTTLAVDAADLGHGSIKDGYVPAMAQHSPKSWYFRADVAHARFDEPGLVAGDRFQMINPDIDDQWAVGAGLGYYFSQRVRGDITWDYRFEADVTGTVPQGTGVGYPGQQKFGLKSNVVLANAYYDFGSRGGFSPYIGMGLGFAVNATERGSVSPNACGACFTAASTAGSTSTSAAGALMAGMSYNINGRLNLDAGYRFMYLGDAQTGVVTGTPVVTPDGHTSVSDIWAHEFRVGLRYDIR